MTIHSKRIACYRYPTTVVLVDDSEGFLTDLKMSLSQQYPYLTFNKPKEALRFLENSNQKICTAGQVSDNTDAVIHGVSNTELEIKVDVQNIHHIAYNAERFNEISVLIVDYEMPGMNGGEFCSRLADLPIQKLMLTGIADHDLAVQLFNRGVINKFLMKNSQNLAAEINDAITELQNDYFLNKTEGLYNNLIMQTGCLLLSPNYRQVFNKVLTQYNINEYYLLDNAGSFLFLRLDGKPIWFLITTEAELNDFIEVGIDQGASENILQMIRHREKIPYFANCEQMFTAQGKQWETHLYHAEYCEGPTPFYYAVVTEGGPVTALDHKKIVSYQHYSEHIWSKP